MADGSPIPTATPPPFTPTQAPARVDLRPLTTSELIDRGFVLYRSHFAGLLLLALLCQAAPLLSQILMTAFKMNPTNNEILDNPKGFMTATGLLTVVAFIAQIVVFCFEVVITFYIGDAYLGKIPSVKDCLRRFKPLIFSSIWTCILNRILIGLTFLFPMAAITALYFYFLRYPPLKPLAIIGFTAVALVLLVASVAPVLIVFMRLMTTVPALALEGLSGWKAIRRSSALVQYDPGLGFLYWGEMRLSFLLLPLFIIELLVLSLTSLPLTIHQFGEIMRHGASGQINAPPDSVMILSQVLTFLAGSIILPLYTVATTLFYYDIRIRREGFDLEFMVRQLEPRK
jgi:hypothetical protein